MSNITETQFDQLCNKCDFLLKHKLNTPYKIANNWLHITHFRPTTLNQYYEVFKKSKLKFFFFLFKKSCFYFGTSLFRLINSILKKENFKIDKIQYESIFVSHLLNQDSFDLNEDFYFYKLPKKFQDHDNRTLQVYINHTRINSNKFKNEKASNSVDKLVLPEYISLPEELKIQFSLLKEAIKMLKQKPSKETNSRIRIQASIEFLSPASHINARIGKQIKDLVKQSKAKYIFTTHEGHAYERVIFSNARNSNDSIMCIGYQHAFILNKQHAVQRKLGREFDPDVVICSGEDGKRKLIKSNYLAKEKILIFGSNRTSKKNILFKQKRDTFLFLPEGDFNECFPLIDLLFELAKLLTSFHFIIRFHPMTKVSILKKQRPQLKDPPKNLTISKKLFEDDLKRADFAIYRGSTTIIKAIENGLIPIYYHKKGENIIDPLFLLNKHKKSIKESKDIHEVVNVNEVVNIKNLNKLNLEIKQFFSPLNYNEVLKLKKLNK